MNNLESNNNSSSTYNIEIKDDSIIISNNQLQQQQQEQEQQQNNKDNNEISILLKRLINNKYVFTIIKENISSIHRILKKRNPLKGSELLKQTSVVKALKYGQTELFFKHIGRLEQYLNIDAACHIIYYASMCGDINVVQQILLRQPNALHDWNISRNKTKRCISRMIQQQWMDLLHLHLESTRESVFINSVVSSAVSLANITVANMVVAILERGNQKHIPRRLSFLESLLITLENTEEYTSIAKLILRKSHLFDPRNIEDIICFGFRYSKKELLELVIEKGLQHHLAQHQLALRYSTRAGIKMIEMYFYFFFDKLKPAAFTHHTLHEIIKQNNLEVLKYVLEKNSNWNESMIDAKLLQKALDLDTLDIANYLLESDICSHQTFVVKNIHPSILTIDLIERLLTSPNVNIQFSDLYATAAEHDRLDVMRYLDSLNGPDFSKFSKPISDAFKVATFTGKKDVLEYIMEKHYDFQFNLPIPTVLTQFDMSVYLDMVELMAISAHNLDCGTLHSIFNFNELNKVYPRLKKVFYILAEHNRISEKESRSFIIASAIRAGEKLDFIKFLYTLDIHKGAAPLEVPAGDGDMELLEFLVVEKKTAVTPSAIKQAAARQQHAALQFLLEKRDENINLNFDFSNDLIAKIFENGDLESYRIYSEHVPEFIIDARGNTSARRYFPRNITTKHICILDLIFEKKLIYAIQMTAMHYILKDRVEHPECLQKMLERWPNQFPIEEVRSSHALYKAIKRNHVTTIKILVESNMLDFSHEKDLKQLAINYGNIEMFDLFSYKPQRQDTELLNNNNSSRKKICNIM